MKTCSTCGLTKFFDGFCKKKASKDGYRPECKACQKEYREVTRVETKTRQSKWYAENKQRVNLKSLIWRNKSPEAYRSHQLRFKLTNPTYNQAYLKVKRQTDSIFRAAEIARGSKRRAALKRAIPKWYTEERELIADLYWITGQSDGILHVDHIVPLQNKLVCGLHCFANLQPLEANENRRKNNRVWPDMP